MPVRAVPPPEIVGEGIIRVGVEFECGPGSAVEGVLDAFEVGRGVTADVAALFEPEFFDSFADKTLMATTRSMTVPRARHTPPSPIIDNSW